MRMNIYAKAGHVNIALAMMVEFGESYGLSGVTVSNNESVCHATFELDYVDETVDLDVIDALIERSAELIRLHTGV